MGVGEEEDGGMGRWGKKGIRSWELGVGEEEDGEMGGRRELGVGGWGRRELGVREEDQSAFPQQ
uniref:Uncharacterized protein n=1 Tax=Desertifilum tharense IPPAS B-1220 TaxID=1781255 RepID=A0ACD5GWA9_9CYAN